jgi:hypothetical protein
MIRLAFVQISGVDDETWRRPVGRGSVTAFCAKDGTIWPESPEERDTATEGSARLPAAQPGDWARGEKARG